MSKAGPVSVADNIRTRWHVRAARQRRVSEARCRLTMEPEPGDTIILEDGTEVPLKKKRGRPKKVKLENGEQTNAMVQQSSGLSALQPVAGHGGAAHAHDTYLPDFPAPMYPHQQHQQLTNDAGNYFQQQPPNSGGGAAGHGARVRAPARRSPRGVYASRARRATRRRPRGPPARRSPPSCCTSSPPAARVGLRLAAPRLSGARRCTRTRRPPYAPQHSPAPPAPAARYALSPHYSHSPAPQGPTRARPRRARRRALPGRVPAACTLHGRRPAHTPYSQHSSPAPSRTPTYTDAHHFAPQPGSGTSGSGSGSGYGGELSHEIGAAISSPAAASPVALDFEPPRDTPGRDSPMGSTDMHPGSNSNSSLSDYNKTSAGSEMSPAGVGGATFGGALYDGEARLHDHYYRQDQGAGVGDSPRLDQMHQHQSSMYPNNFNRSPPAGGGEAFSPLGAAFRPPDAHTPHPPHDAHDALDHQQHLHQPGSPGEYTGAVKPKAQDVASKSLSGLESLQTNAMVQQSSGLSALQPVAGHGGAAHAHDTYLPDFPAPMYPHQQHQQLTNDAGNYFQQQPPNSGMESPLEVAAPLGMARAYGSPGAYGSPRGVYASPRSQGYSPRRARRAGQRRRVVRARATAAGGLLGGRRAPRLPPRRRPPAPPRCLGSGPSSDSADSGLGRHVLAFGFTPRPWYSPGSWPHRNDIV
uniref:Uncharacterized protein n=1 Tax=Heliothis virescens TaxID=7102 RepID=A0A2A4J511_HELVI